MPHIVGSTVMFGMVLAERLVGMGLTLSVVLLKLMSPIKFFLIVHWYRSKNFTQTKIVENDFEVFCVVIGG